MILEIPEIRLCSFHQKKLFFFIKKLFHQSLKITKEERKLWTHTSQWGLYVAVGTAAFDAFSLLDVKCTLLLFRSPFD